MKIQDYKIGNIYADTNENVFMLGSKSFQKLISHYYETKECLFDSVKISISKLKDLGFKKVGDEYRIVIKNKFIFSLEFYFDGKYSIWLNRKHLLKIQYIHELQDIVRMFSKCELELKNFS